jgi:small-conductance mechanosensitive channel
MVDQKIDRINELSSQIKLSVIWVAIASTQFGFHLTAAMWKRPDIFYPFDLLLWGFIDIFWLLRMRGVLAGLAFNVPVEGAATAKRNVLLLLLYTLCTGIISFCFAVSVLAAKSFGRLYVIAVVVLAPLTVGMILLTIQKAKRLTGWFLGHTNEVFV